MADGSEVAVKRMPVQRCERTAENEKEILSLLETEKSPFVVSYRGFYNDGNFMYLVIDLCEESLEKLVDFSSIEHLQQHGQRMIKEILSGLEFLHAKGILHRDLKPSNILVDIEGCMKLADFGISRVLKEEETGVETGANGSIGWVPPEVIEARKREGKGPFKKQSDVYVAGMIFFFILTKGQHPFGGTDDRMRNIAREKPVNLKKLSERKARKFVSWLIKHKIDERPYATDALNGPYLSEIFSPGMS
ncbi:serine/threonine-protein kinase/endoribonuclease IRE1-like [Dendronephthya gigantea]|uniref:serine/threonine-protein kinase/endoribonuclease IRE1-like n=1 Tax=Dendronephthya gigantea TaxID=151771 RepID=UPI00106C6628|nr:serine/threonine-protein kinase/endoribonuclease IRE1-like [Dendronephthya gigantea]